MRRGHAFVAAMVALGCLVSIANAQNERDKAVRKDKQELAEDESWIYDDLDTALEAAAKSKRPLMIVFR